MAMKKFHVGVKAIIVDSERGVLFMKNIKGFWDIPGGRIDDNESIEKTMQRELSEELPGTKLVSIDSIEGAFRLQKDIEPGVSLVLLYHVVKASLPKDIVLSDEHTEYMWARDIDSIPDLSWSPQLKEIVKELLKDR